MLVLSGVLLALLVILFVAQYLKLQLSRGRFPPGPTPLPIIGNLGALGFELRHETLMKLAKTYGNIFTVWMGSTPVIVLNGCQSIRDGLISHSEEFSGRPPAPVFERLSRGKGVVMSTGHTWKQHRRFAQLALGNLGLRNKILERRIQDEAQYLLDFFYALKGEAIEPRQGIVHAATNVISTVLFGHRFSGEDKVFLHLIESTDYISSFMFSKWARLYDAFPRLMDLLRTATLGRLFESNAFLENYAQQEIDIHKENGVPEEPQDVIDYYLAQISRTKSHFSTRDWRACKNQRLSQAWAEPEVWLVKVSADVTSVYDESNLIRVLVELLGGGKETTTHTLEWGLLYMVTQPDIQEKVQQELDTVLGKSHVIEYEDRKRLPYTNAVIHEIQRHSNVQSVGIVRQAVMETSLQGYHIEKGTILLANLASALHDQDYWESPHQFNPGHFLDRDGNFVTNDAFLPFSAGHRVCSGEQMARIELFIFFSNLLRAFTFRLPEGVKEVNMNYEFGASLKPHPYEICAVAR